MNTSTYQIIQVNQEHNLYQVELTTQESKKIIFFHVTQETDLLLKNGEVVEKQLFVLKPVVFDPRTSRFSAASEVAGESFQEALDLLISRFS
ncbi:MAG: hypothetical protein QXS68_07700 [Candidatus Methanomethylicaceae archaeon]